MSKIQASARIRIIHDKIGVFKRAAADYINQVRKEILELCMKSEKHTKVLQLS